MGPARWTLGKPQTGMAGWATGQRKGFKLATCPHAVGYEAAEPPHDPKLLRL